VYNILKEEILSAFAENHGFTRGAPSYQDKGFSVKPVFVALSPQAQRNARLSI